MHSVLNKNFHCRRGLLASVLAGSLFTEILVAAANHVTFQVNLGVQRMLGNFNPQSGDTAVVSGNFSTPDWTTTSTLSSLTENPDVYVGTFPSDIAGGSTIQYKFIINPGGNSSANQLSWESGDNRTATATTADQALPVVYFNNVTNAPAPGTNAPPEFLAGADMSHLVFFEDRDITYRANGEVRDALDILQERGLNFVRLRLFNSTDSQGTNNPYNYINNLNYNLPLAVRVKNAGLKFLLDFHYSDTWADPGKQTKPAAWTNLTFAELKTEIRSFSSNAVAAFAAVGAMPDYVQIGNEIIGGMLWDDGRVGGSFDNSSQWSQLSQLITNAIQGVREAAGTQMPKIIIHLDRGGDWNATRWFFDNLIARQVTFDLIGQSYYPWWHGSPQALQTCLNNAAVRYGKPQIIMETAFPRSNSTNIFGIPASTNGQVQFVAELAKIVKSVPGGLGVGIVWWGSEYQALAGYNLAGFHQRSLFGSGGEVLPAAAALGALTAPVQLSSRLHDGDLELQWPLSGAGHTLVSNTNLKQPTWTNVTNAIQSTGSVFQTTVPVETKGSRFFRLRSN
jgi:arabinogalactan endo-1,4-beta-galactosidase